MIAALRRAVVAILRLPPGLPPTPAGGHAQVRVMRASPRWIQYRSIFLYLAAVALAAAFLGGAVASLVEGELIALALVALVSAFAAAWLFVSWFAVRIEYELRAYVLTDRSLRVREGAWIFKEMTLTYANVQNVQVLQGPLQRLFGIADVRVDTAGGGSGSTEKGGSGGGHAVTLAGLENAQEVRDEILSFVKHRESGSGLGDPDDPRRTVAALDGSGALQELARVRDAASMLRAVLERA